MVECGIGRQFVARAEGVAARLTYAFFKLLPIDAASAVGGWLARAIGPHLGISKRARDNLRRALPGITETEIARIVRGMWDNLGRVVTEYPHLAELELGGGRVESRRLADILTRGKPGTRYIFFSAHYGNWEVALLATKHHGLDAVGIYRAANNPFVDRLMAEARSVIGIEMVPKGAAAAKRALAALSKGRHLCMLVDQKMNDGIAVPFFGRDAMTAPALARLALRQDCVVVPVRVERLNGARFRLTAEEPLPLPRSGDVQADTLALMGAVNAAVERWVRERPEQWFWLHRRWPD